MVNIQHGIRNNIGGSGFTVEASVVRSVRQPLDTDLEKVLGRLSEDTSDFVNYRNISNLGVTLVALGTPIMRELMPVNHRGTISQVAVNEFETGINGELSGARFKSIDVSIDPLNALGLYGRRKQLLGLRLDPKDNRLAQDWVIGERYISENYEGDNGEPFSRRFVKKNTTKLSPNIIIGEIDYSNLDQSAAQSLRKDPTDFITRAANDRVAVNQEELGRPVQVEPIVFPEFIGLGGLSVICHRRTS